MRRLGPAALIVGLLTIAGAATAADRLSVRLEARPLGLAAGDPWRATFELRRAGRPLRGARPRLWIRRGTTVRSFAAVEARRGVYRARVTFPAPGSWRYGVALGAQRLSLGSTTVGPRPAAVARPIAVAVSQDGRVAIADRDGNRVLILDSAGESAVATSLASPISVGFDRASALFVGDDYSIYGVESGGSRTRVAGNGSRGYSGDGGPATVASLGGPTGFAFEPAGGFVISEYDGHVRRVRADGTIETIAGNGTEGYAGDGGPARNALIAAPHDIEALADGSLILADSHNGRIRRIDPAGTITTVASGLAAPVSVAAAPDGTLVVAEAGLNRIVRLSLDGRRTVVAGTGAPRSTGDGGPAARATLNVPSGVAVAGNGTLYVTEFEGRRVRRIDARTGRISTVARR
jgi:outer membrane protein assembly factor BamB